jgi:predicted ester cyclase
MATGEKFLGREGVARFYTGLFDGMPDANFELISVTIGETGVVEESVLTGTHSGVLFGRAPTGKKLRLPLVIIFPAEDGLFTGERLYFDLGVLEKQLS